MYRVLSAFVNKARESLVGLPELLTLKRPNARLCGERVLNRARRLTLPKEAKFSPVIEAKSRRIHVLALFHALRDITSA